MEQVNGEEVSVGLAASVQFVVREFRTPVVRDALVLGKRSPIGCVAMRKALSLMQTCAFDHIEFQDDRINAVLARDTVVRLIGREELIRLVVDRIKPLMRDTDILLLDIAAEVRLDGRAALSA